VAKKLEEDIRRDFYKLMSSQSKIAAKAAGRAVDVSAEDFNDEGDEAIKDMIDEPAGKGEE